MICRFFDNREDLTCTSHHGWYDIVNGRYVWRDCTPERKWCEVQFEFAFTANLTSALAYPQPTRG